MRLFKWFIILVILGGIGYGLYIRLAVPHGPPPGAMMMGGGPPPQVDVAAVIRRDVQTWREYSGRLSATEEAEVLPRVSGMIEKVHFADGAIVAEGDLLFTIDPAPYKAAVDQAQGVLTSAQAQGNLARTEFKRAESLYQDRTISQRDYDQRRNARDVADASARSAQAALEAAKLNLGYTNIRAPIGGRVGRAEITAGNIVQAGPGAPVLTTIVSYDPIYADFDMDEAAYLVYAQAGGMEGTEIPVFLGLTSETGEPHRGRIESFDNRVNPASGTVRVRAVFDNKDGLLIPGAFARIRVGSPVTVSALLIPDTAIGTDQDKKFVLLVGPENKVEYRPVKPGMMADNLRIIEGGLSEGDKIIVNGLQRARSGAPVTPQIVPMEGGNVPSAIPAAAGGGDPQPVAAPDTPVEQPPADEPQQP